MTIHVIEVRNVNEALPQGVDYLRFAGYRAQSRNGPVLVAPGPVATVYTHPDQRVLLMPARDANPVFHLVEALWMLAGRDTVADLLPFNANYANYAEADGHVHGAYGFRWRRHWGTNQLRHVISELKANPDSRRVVLSMWDPQLDLGAEKADLPCNTHVYFMVRDGYLDMTVCCRSNDIIWGAYGANVVTFSILQEVVAHACGYKLGKYIQFSNNYHLYEENEVAKRVIAAMVDYEPPYYNPYDGDIEATPLIADGEDASMFLADCEDFFTPAPAQRTRFFQRVVEPLVRNYLARKEGLDFNVEMVHPSDWSVAFEEWVARRDAK
jgi:hypothetical protein